MQAKMMEMTVSSTVTMPPLAMNQNQSFITLKLMRPPLPAEPVEPKLHSCVTVMPVVVTRSALNL